MGAELLPAWYYINVEKRAEIASRSLSSLRTSNRRRARTSHRQGPRCWSPAFIILFIILFYLKGKIASLLVKVTHIIWKYSQCSWKMCCLHWAASVAPLSVRVLFWDLRRICQVLIAEACREGTSWMIYFHRQDLRADKKITLREKHEDWAWGKPRCCWPGSFPAPSGFCWSLCRESSQPVAKGK